MFGKDGPATSGSLKMQVAQLASYHEYNVYTNSIRTFVVFLLPPQLVSTITHTHTQAPDAPGQYEVRYYPRWLDSATTGHGHHGYWAPTTFTVTPAYDRN